MKNLKTITTNDLTNEQIELAKKQYLKNKIATQRATAKYAILLQKCKQQNIVANDDEIDNYLKTHNK